MCMLVFLVEHKHNRNGGQSAKNRNRDRNVRAETQTETGLLGLIQINVEMQSLRQVAQPAAVVGQAVVKGVQIMAHVST